MQSVPIFLILHNIRSVYNVGAIFRTADAVGVLKIYCTGYTATPIDRFGRTRIDFAKSALGAEQSVAWEYVEDPLFLIDRLKRDNVQVVALEQDARAIDYKTFIPERPLALLVGNEREGVSEELRSLSDIIISIPMKGAKESLNVSVALGVALFRIAGV